MAECDESVEPAVDIDLSGGVAKQTVLTVGVVEERGVVETVAAAHDRLAIERVGKTEARSDVAAVGMDEPAIHCRETVLAGRPDDGAGAPARVRVRHLKRVTFGPARRGADHA